VNRPAVEVADIFGRFGASFLEQYPTSAQQRRVIAAIRACRTAVLGGHLERCGHCGHERNAYNSCRDRHCTKCGSLPRDLWVEARKADLLPVPYFHVVFTLVESLRPVALQNPATVYNLLFQAAATTLQKVAADPKHLGARIGLFAVLHTWNQQLLYHPHIHCVVPGGGLSPDDDRWIPARNNFFLPVRVLSEVYRGVFMSALQQAYQKGQLSWHGELEHLQDPAAFRRFIQPAWKNEWVVYAKPPFAGPEGVVEYLGRYTHRIAISNHRLVRQDEATVTFACKNRRQDNRRSLHTLAGHEFMRRFLLHVLPPRFVRLRHYGFLANARRGELLARCRQLLHVPAPVDAGVTNEWPAWGPHPLEDPSGGHHRLQHRPVPRMPRRAHAKCRNAPASAGDDTARGNANGRSHPRQLMTTQPHPPSHQHNRCTPGGANHRPLPRGHHSPAERLSDATKIDLCGGHPQHRSQHRPRRLTQAGRATYLPRPGTQPNPIGV